MTTRVLVISFICVLITTPSLHAQNRWALVVGIAGYPFFPEGERLQYAARDAQDFAAFIETPRGGSFPANNVHLVTNGDAKRERLYAEFNWLYQTPGPGDLVYVFFAGHGAEDKNILYFLPYDALKDRPEALGIPMGEFFRRVTSDLAAKQVIVFIDACFAAGAAEGGRSPLSIDIRRQWDELNSKEGQVSMALFSSLANQRSWEDPELGGGHGLFTWYLLDGLRGAAPKTLDGWINADSLWSYVKDQVEKRSRERFGVAQTPVASSRFKTNFALAYAAGLETATTPPAETTKTILPSAPVKDSPAPGPAVTKNLGIRLQEVSVKSGAKNGDKWVIDVLVNDRLAFSVPQTSYINKKTYTHDELAGPDQPLSSILPFQESSAVQVRGYWISEVAGKVSIPSATSFSLPVKARTGRESDGFFEFNFTVVPTGTDKFRITLQSVRGRKVGLTFGEQDWTFKILVNGTTLEKIPSSPCLKSNKNTSL